ncbi:FR47-like protein [Fragilaria crotonensis]|nr:FR47-like protein [Fragilaria crotonensis]
MGDSDVLIEAADFFTDAFWASKLPGSQQMQPRQRTLFLNSQITEFRRRYGSPKYGPDRTAELLIAKRRNGDIVGCCGIELDRIPQDGPKKVARTTLSAPLMSNLAVGKKYRRLGVARDMVEAVETLVRREWGLDELYLYVEQRNAPAVRLYQTLGYRTVWTDPSATTLVPAVEEEGRSSGGGGGMAQVPTTLLCMRKSLKRGGGIFGRFFS